MLDCTDCVNRTEFDLLGNPECMTALISSLRRWPNISGIIFFKDGNWRKITRKHLDLLAEFSSAVEEAKRHNPDGRESVAPLMRDPILAYISLATEAMISAKKRKSIRKLVDKIQDTALIRRFLRQPGLALATRTQVYTKIFEDLQPVLAPEASKTEKVDEYDVAAYTFRIFSTPLEQAYLEVYPREGVKDVSELSQYLSQELRKTVEREELFGDTETTLRKRMSRAYNIYMDRSGGALGLTPSQLRTSIVMATFRSLELHSIAPLLLDQNIEEIFLDGVDTPLYADHRRWGRCITSIYLSPKEIEALKTRCRLEGESRLDEATPSLKTELITDTFHVRVSIDVAPLNADGVSVSIRKLRKRLYTLPELIANGTISREAASYLLYCFLRRRNIGVVGEPGSGKTTLANSILGLTPRHWRTIYVEDVIETHDLRPHGVHQIRLRVDPVESLTTSSRRKSDEIVKLLHRTPTYIFLGEIQTKEHSKALFHAMSAGIRAMFTVHANSIQQVIRRWTIQHQVNPISIMNLDIAVLTGRTHLEGHGKRRILGIFEISKDNGKHWNTDEVSLDASLAKVKEIYARPAGHRLVRTEKQLHMTPCVSSITRFEDKGEEEFYAELLEIKSALNELVVTRQFQLPEVRKHVERAVRRHHHDHQGR